MSSLMLTVFLALLALPVASASPRGQAAAGSADALVQQLREFPAALPATARSDGSIDPVEQRREQVYAQLRALGQEALPALTRGLSSSDVQLRRNVALFLLVLSSGLYNHTAPESRMDIRPCLPALVTALKDADGRVRALAAQAVGEIGADAAAAVPQLVSLLKNPEEGSRTTACFALARIGPAAKDALPALRAALADPSAYVRRCAQRAIDRIEGR